MASRKPAEPADVAGVIAPPPLIYGGFLLVGIALNLAWPMAIVGRDLPDEARYAIAAVLGGLGLAIAMAALLQFHKAGTAVHPHHPTSALVTTGLYRYSRNPIYVAQTAIYLAIAVLADNWWALILILPTLMLIHGGVIVREEAYLERIFGEAYRAYRSGVRRWL